jgi:plasmid stabilization system protein ParE
MDAAFREWVVAFGQDGYVVQYRIERDKVVLLAVRHGREAGYDEGVGGPVGDGD